MESNLRLRGPLTVYLLIAGIVSYCQSDAINADFIAYATVAHRVIESPAMSVTGSWSPLYSWLMAPLCALGIDDLLAGRAILLLAGLGYIAVIHRLGKQFFPPTSPVNRLMIRGVLACATVQAIWFSTYLLNPDLLASAIIFLYLAQLTDPKTGKSIPRGFMAGMVLGLAYLAKAYMLPFGIVQFLMFLVAEKAFRSNGNGMPQSRFRLLPLASLLIGLGIIAGPWIFVLSNKYERCTYTNAGRANHANVGPGSFGKDPLWHPPLTPDYILEPVIAPEWSPLASLDNFKHQLFLIYHNGLNCIGLIPGWLAMTGLALAASMRRRKAVAISPLAVWATITAAIYCSGYLMVNLEARYIAPVVAPLLCLATAALVREFLECELAIQTREGLQRFMAPMSCERKWTIGVVSLVLAFGAVDLYSIACIALYHPQSARMSTFRAIAQRLEEAGIGDQPTASNRWHDGLYIAYARGRVSSYLGSPQSASREGATEELLSKGVSLHLHWKLEEEPTVTSWPLDQFIAGFFSRRLTIIDPWQASQKVEVYIR